MTISAGDRSPARLAGSRSLLVFLALLCATLAVQAGAEADSVAATSPTLLTAPQHPVRQRSPQVSLSRLDQRMQLLTKELNLDEQQQGSVRTILLLQRSEVIKAWSDPSVPAAIRVSALQGITERTADRIRSVLTDAQREKYLKARLHETPVGAPGGDVAKWMKTAQAH